MLEPLSGAMTLQMEERNAVLSASLLLLAGVALGWKLKELRLKYLKAKRDFFMRKANATHERLAGGEDAHEVGFVCSKKQIPAPSD